MMRKTPTVLIVEEIPERLKAVRSILENQPLKIFSSKDVKSASTKLNEIEPDLVIMDLSTQFGQKRALCDYMFRRKGNHVKVLFIVEKGFPELIFASSDYFAGYITKPFYAGDILGKLHSVLYDKYLQLMTT